MADDRQDLWEILELIAVADPGDEAFARAVALASTVTDFDTLLVYAIHHRMLPGLAEFLQRTDALPTLPASIRKLLEGALDWNRYRVRLSVDEACSIAAQLRERGITVVFNKGIVCQASLYDARGTRYFSDIDLMVHPDQGLELTRALVELGYVEGKQYDSKQERLVDIPRSTQMIYRLYPDHLPHFHRLAPGTGVPCRRVDVAFSLTWYGSAWQVPIEEALSARVSLPVGAGGPGATPVLPALNPVHGFLFLALHLFRESWFQRNMRATGSPRLTQFADVWKFWLRFARAHAAGLRETIERCHLAPPVAWICAHLDSLYGGDTVGELKLHEYCQPEWLNSAGATSGGYLRWAGDMRSRLRRTLPIELTPATDPPFGAQARGDRG